jgi:type I restriction enzyme S subunit
MPPYHEQLEVVTYLKTQTAKLDALVDEARIAISLLNERRAALIAAAVTGQIDVRQAGELVPA